jgi:uroporphyrinogen-III synthase
VSTSGSDPSGRLDGVRVLVTRRPEQADELTRRLAALGASVTEVAAVAVEPPADPRPLMAALGRIEGYDWLVLTSANAVGAVSRALGSLARGLPRGVRIASVGPATAVAVREAFSREPDLVPGSEFRGEGLAEAFAGTAVAGRRMVLPTSDRARDVVASALRDRGAIVDVVGAYRTVAPADLAQRLAAALDAGIDVLTFASPSAVENVVAASGGRLVGLAAAVIGPVTERAARAAGLRVVAVASPSTVEGLVRALGDGMGGVAADRGKTAAGQP